MSDAAAHARPMPLIPWLGDDHVTRLFLATALFLVASFFVLVPVWLLDNRLLDSAAIWTKPQKFNISLAVHFLTLAVLAQQVPRAARSDKAMLFFAYLASGSLLFESVYLTIQAARGRRSHFNFDTPAESGLYALMGLGAFLMVLAAFILAIKIWRNADRSAPGFGKGLWLGSIIGLTSGFVLTMVLAGHMSTIGRYVGAPLEGGGSVIPFFGWSREYGDLRPAHFVTLHLMQTLPIAGWLADRYRWPAMPVVLGVAALQIAVAIALFIQALAGKPFWPA